MAQYEIPLFIDGAELPTGEEGSAEFSDPGTGRAIGTYAVAGKGDVDAAVAAARSSFDSGAWRRMRPFERGRVLQRIADGLTAERDRIARTVTLDSGKPLRDAYWEVDCSARFFEFYAGAADKLHGSSIPLGDGYMDWTIKTPIGVSAQIVPWNYPLQVAVRGIAPALTAGCSVVAKPSVETPACLADLARISRQAGLPDGVLNVVTGSGSVVGDWLARHPGVDQLTFTGSVEVGERVTQAAATHAIPVVMELGGKSPQVVFADADLELTVPTLLAGMYTHAGQVCNAGTRLLVESSVHDEVVERLHTATSQMRLGHGLNDPDLGPVVSAAQRTAVEKYMDLARSEGQLLEGADLPDDPELAAGNYVRPSLVVGVSNYSRIAREEVFGPLLTIIPFDEVDEGFALAEDSEFGLVAGLFTSDVGKVMRGAQELNAGQIWVNNFGVGLDVEFPFGGVRRSGFGREKGLEALAAYQQVKNVCVAF